MNRSLVAGVGLLTLAAAIPAVAADIPVRQVYAPPAVLFSWTGFYVGINGGGGWSNNQLTVLPQNDPDRGLVGWARGGRGVGSTDRIEPLSVHKLDPDFAHDYLCCVGAG